MRKIVIYVSFVVASLVVITLFVTSVTYAQLFFAVLLYIPLVYFAFDAFLHKTDQAKHTLVPAVSHKKTHVPKEDVSILDIDKRTFLKLIGATGISFLIFSIFAKRTDIPFIGKIMNSGAQPANTLVQASPTQGQPTDGYQITEIDEDVDTYYGFTNHDGAWYIMKQDNDTGSFRYSRGSSGFSDSWGKRSKLTYDYYYNLF